MRPLTPILFTVFLAACAAPGIRIEDSPSELALPAPASDRSPRAAPGQWEEGSPHPRGRAHFEVAFGDFAHEVDSSTPPLDTDTRAVRTGIHFEMGGERFAGGVDVHVTTTDDELTSFGTPGTTEAVALDVFPHFTYRPETGERYRMPLRVGPSISLLQLEDSVGLPEQKLLYLHLGARIELAPEVDIVQSDGFVLSAYVRGHLGAAATIIDAELVGGVDDTFSSTALRYGVQAGLLASFSGFEAGVGVVHNGTRVEESDPELIGLSSVVIQEADFEFTGLLISIGGRW